MTTMDAAIGEGGAIERLRREPLTVALVAACGDTPCHLVGGAVRDRVLCLATHDLDAVVAGRGREIAAALAAALPARLVLLGGREFAAYRLVTPAGEVLDLWDRGEMTLADDLARRDFTVNAVAVEARSGAVIDPFGGLADLSRRTLRAVTPESFRGDPLRVLRLVRFELQLPAFAAEPATLTLARAAVPRLPEMAAERIREELRLIFAHPAAERGLRRLAGLGVYPWLWRRAPGPAAEAEADTDARQGTALAAAEMAALSACAAFLDQSLDRAAPSAWEPPDLPAARLAATCRYLDAPTATPADVPASIVSGALDRLERAGYVAPRQAAEIRPLLAPEIALPPAGRGARFALARRRYLHRHGRRWLTTACAAGGAAAVHGRAARERWRRAARALCGLAVREGRGLIAPPRLLGGEDVQRLLGISAGPAVGRALAALTAAQVDDLVRTRDDAERYLKESWS